MGKLKKDLNYYLNLPYKMEIEPISEDEGGGYFARLPQFGLSITGDGDTIEEALEMLEKFKKRSFKRYLEENRIIPEPKDEKQLDDYSGRILLRTPKALHQMIAINATKNEVSQNQYINFLLNKSLFKEERNQIEAKIEESVNLTIRKVLFEVTHKKQYELERINKKKPFDIENDIYAEDYKAA